MPISMIKNCNHSHIFSYLNKYQLSMCYLKYMEKKTLNLFKITNISLLVKLLERKEIFMILNKLCS